MTTALLDPVVEDAIPEGLVDARPVLDRGTNNVWETVERNRSRIASALQEGCRARGVEALVLESQPYVHPAWVKVECWLPVGERTLTSRSSMTITLTATPFHEFETVFKVEWTRSGRSGALHDIYDINAQNTKAALELICTPRSAVELRDAMSLLFKEWQLRQEWWHFWKPKNRLTTIRKDWVMITSLVAILVGVALLALALVPSGSGNLYSEANPVVDKADVSDQVAHNEVRSRSAYRLVSNTLTSQALPQLTLSTVHNGVLETSDPTLSDGRHWEAWEYSAGGGEQLVVRMASNDFDAFVYVGRWNAAGTFDEMASNDNSGTETTASEVSFTAATTGTYVVLATSSAGGTGTYYIGIAKAEATAPAESPPVSSNSFTAPVDSSSMALQPADQTYGAYDDTNAAALPLFGGFLLLTGLIGAILRGLAPGYVRSPGKPIAEPRYLRYLDSWQTVIFGAGADSSELKQKLLELFEGAHQQRFGCGVERIWYWGLDSKIEREQIVLRYGRALVFCHIYSYGTDLYVGWDAQMNLGTWIEKKIARGVEKATRKRVELMTVEHAVQNVSEYDLVDLNCLAEWTHAQMTQVLKHYVREREIDQEIDFKIIRGERGGVLPRQEQQKQRKSRFLRTA